MTSRVILNTAGKPQSTNNLSKKLASTDYRGLQNINWLCPTNYGKLICVSRKCTQWLKFSGNA